MVHVSYLTSPWKTKEWGSYGIFADVRAWVTIQENKKKKTSKDLRKLGNIKKILKPCKIIA